MDRKERISAYINSKEYVPLKFEELVLVLDVPDKDENELCDILSELCFEGRIYKTKKGRYAPVNPESRIAAGKLFCSAKGFFGFIVCEAENEDDIFISGDDMADALNGDRVLVSITEDEKSGHCRQGRVIRVLERHNKTVVGVIYKKKGGYLCLRPDNRRIYTKIIIPPKKSMSARIGDRAAAAVAKYEKNGKVFGELVSILGNENSLKSCVEGIIIENGIKQEFNEDTLREADKIRQFVDEEAAGGREDLRGMIIFTIDGDDARDFDDAVSLTLTDNGNYCLGVHIADVSEYVTEGSALDREAYERGTSVYLADRVIPMLHEKLSNGICSLNPNVDRLTLSVFMEISGDGTVVNHRLVKSVIRSAERMTYNNVNSILEDSDETLSKKYSHLVPTLKLMEGLSRILYNKRSKRGAVNFDFPESKVIVNNEGEPIKIVKETRGVSNKMIEEFMLAANETVAEYAFWAKIPFIYRNHESPSTDKILAFSEFIHRFGLSIKGKIDRDNPIHPKALQRILDEIHGTPNERIIASTMLQSLMKAKYSNENLGHFGLAARYYCHFTSPIRRYPDLVIHRIIKSFIDGKLSESRLSYLGGFTAAASAHSSECEVNAEHAERDVDDLMKTAYMRDFTGKSFEAVISNITSFGMFVELENSVEGLIRSENMTDNYYEFDENTGLLTGRRKKRKYAAGDCVRVTLARADIMLRQIDFVLTKDADEKLLEKIESGSSKPRLKKEHKKSEHKKEISKKYKKRKKR